jgi:SCP-2 sterol transfer family
LLWALERSVDGSAFGKRRTVVRLELTDQPATRRYWWFVNAQAAVELCLEDPGFDTDLYLACTLPDMIYLIRGDLALAKAIAAGRLDVHGDADKRRALTAWLNLSPLAAVEPARALLAAPAG